MANHRPESRRDQRDDEPLYARFISDARRAEARSSLPPLCQHCGERTDCHHSRWGECHNCDSPAPNNFNLCDIVWREAVATRKTGVQTARQFFNLLTFAARVALMRDLLARQQAASAGMGRVTPTMRWLAAGLRPFTL
jgi:hypothetical protein